MNKWLDRYESGGLVSKNSLNRNVTCSNCGWSWKLSDGGLDPMTCHKCGGDIKMREGGELDEYQDRGEYRGQVPTSDNLQYQKPIVSNFIVDPLSGGYVHDPARAVALLNQPTNAGTISKTKDRSVGKQIYNVAINPMTSAQQLINKQPVTGLGPKNPYDFAFDAFPAMMAARQLPQIPGNIQNGEYLQAGLNALSVIPFLPKIPRGLPRVLSEGQAYEGAPHIYEDMVPINGRYQPRTVITDAGVKDEILGLEATPVIPLNQIEYPVTPNKFLYGPHSSFGRMEQGVVTDTYRGMPPGTNTYTSTLPSYTSFPNIIKLFGFVRKKSIVSEAAPLSKLERQALVTQEDLARANRDAITFSQSSANRAKLQEFRPGQDFSVTNQQARFIDDPESLKLYESYKLENDPSLSIQQYLGESRGQYGARDYGDLNDVVLIDKNLPATSNIPSRSAYTDAMHETTHSRSIRLGATNAEKEIASDAWSPMIKKNNFGMPEEEAFAVQNELRVDKLKDIKGDKVYTEKDIPDIKKGLQEMINERHEYLRNVNIEDFNIPALIKSLNKIGLGAAVLGIAGKETLEQKKKGGPIVTNRGQWDYPGQTTIIPSNEITMTGVNYPVLGVDNTGHQIMMQPGMNYTFPGQYVTEYPMMQGGGQHGGLDRWFAEKWVDIKTGKPCGRQEGENRNYPACRPSKRISSDTPKTSSELSSSERERFKQEKTSSQRISYNHNRKEYGGENIDNMNYLNYMKSGGNVPTNPELYSRVKSEAKSKFNSWPSAYGSAWLVKTYKNRGGGYRKAEYGMEVMGNGGVPNNPGFNSLPEYVQQNIINNMATGGQKIPPQLAYARFAAAGNLNQLGRYGYEDGGEEDVYWRTKKPMVNDPSMDAISKVLLQRNQDKNFMQRAAGFGNQNGIPTRYIDGQNPESNDMSTLLMGSEDNYVFPTIIEKAPGQLSYQPNQRQEYIQAPTEDIADYFATKGYKRVANDMYGMNYKQGGSVTLNAGGEQHRIYVKTTNKGEGDKGHIMVNHPTMDKGMWDTIDLTQKSGAKTIAQGVATTKEWHRENPYMKEYGGDVPMYANGGGIPERYKNMGFTHVGQKKQGDGKHKWKVLAKKGDQYKVVQGGWRGMQDFKQHHSEQRKENFWNRMGGRNSSKATDPFSPLYWHKRLGTWENGGQTMAIGGQTMMNPVTRKDNRNWLEFLKN